MKPIHLLLFSGFLSINCLLQQESLQGQDLQIGEHAAIPPRGWNSYDSFSWTINEEEFLNNAQLVAKRLKSSGYEYVVLDYLWYRRKVKGAHPDSFGFDMIDQWGRMLPDPERWPSSAGGKGLSVVAQKVHSMGLKFGLHVMRGISTQAVNANSNILDITTGRPFQQASRKWTAQDIGIKERACGWMPHGFMSVNTSLDAGKAFLRSLYKQYAAWGVDFVKLDCVFGEDLDRDEINVVSEFLKGESSQIVFSLSPGKQATPEMATAVSGLVNMYRVTADDWDTWPDVASHFDVARDFSAANLTGAAGLLGKSWPDLDMLPLGWLTDPASNEGPKRYCQLTPDEQKTQVTLWSIARSPLMFGGDMRKLDDDTYKLLTEPTLLQINSHSSNNKEFKHVNGRETVHTEPSWLVSLWRFVYRPIASLLIIDPMNPTPDGVRAWIATGNQGAVYVAFFNLNEEKMAMSIELSELDMALPGRNINGGTCKGKEIWTGNDLGVVQQSLKATVYRHGVALFVLHC